MDIPKKKKKNTTSKWDDKLRYWAEIKEMELMKSLLRNFILFILET